MIESSFKYRKRLKNINIIYQCIGIIIVLIIFFTPDIGFYRLIGFIVLLIIYIRIYKSRNAILQIEYNEENKEFTFYSFNKKKIRVSEIFYSEEIDGYRIYNSKKKYLVKINRFDWSNYEKLIDALVMQKKSKEVEKSESLIKEIIKSELKDPTDYGNIIN